MWNCIEDGIKMGSKKSLRHAYIYCDKITFMKSSKEQLINDIQNLLNRYEGLKPTYIDPKLLHFMDETTLRNIIDSLLRQQEKTNESNQDWLEQFKKY